MLAEELQIYRDTYELCKALMKHTRNVSREVKYSDYAELRKDAKSALDMIFLINSDIAERPKYLERYLYFVSNVKSNVRLLHDGSYLDTKFTTHIMRFIDKINKQAIGWRNATLRNSRNR